MAKQIKHIRTAQRSFPHVSTLNSTWILMNSATDIWPDGLEAAAANLATTLWTIT